MSSPAHRAAPSSSSPSPSPSPSSPHKLNGGIVEQLEQHHGLIGYSFANSKKCGYARTLAVWRDEDSMMKFVTSGAHLAPIEPLDSAAVTSATPSAMAL